MTDKRVYSHTQALCSHCGAKAQARIVRVDGRVEMEKFCPEHGLSSVLISSDVDWFDRSRSYVKPKHPPLEVGVREFRGCPDSCGLCPEHQQHTCLPVVEITGLCNMDCPICLKDRSLIPEMSVAEFEHVLEELMRVEGKVDVLNISGGEPTTHSRLEELFRCAAEKRVTQTTVSTNGRLLYQRKSMRDLFRKYDVIASIQFDGFDSAAWKTLRGHDLTEEKLALMGLLEAEGIKYSLVSTVAKGINDGEITKIVDFFFRSQALSLMFQPATYTAGARALSPGVSRLTTADVVREIEKSAFVAPGDFNPLPCSHYSCFSLSYYFRLEPGRYASLKQLLGQDRYLNIIANRTLPGLDSDGLGLMKERLYEMWSAADSSDDNEKVLRRIKELLARMNDPGFNSRKAMSLGFESMKSVFIHYLMDRDTMDLGRLIRCCNMYAQRDGRLIPMCAQNVFIQESHAS